jgi:hypothetical protein
MKAAPPKHWHVWGLILAGDFADLTFWHTKHKKDPVVIAKTWPDKPPTEEQTEQRTKFHAAVLTWLALGKAEREAYRTAVARLSLPMTGFNLFMAFALRPDPTAKRTIERQARVTLA